MSLFSGTRLTDRDIDVGTQKRVKDIVRRLWVAQIDPDDASRQLIDLIVRSANAKTRVQARDTKESEDVTKQSAG